MATGRPRPPTPEREARLRGLHACGASTPAIAAELRVSDAVVAAWLKDFGLAANRAPCGRAFWTPEKVEEARRVAAEEGVSSETAARLGCTQKAFRDKADSMRWPKRDLNAEKRAARFARAARAKALSAAGWKLEAIAADLGVSTSRVSDYLCLRDDGAGAARAAAPAGVGPKRAKGAGSGAAAAEERAKGGPRPRRADDAPARPGWPKMLRCLGPCGRMRVTPRAEERMCGCHRGTRLYDAHEHAIAGARRGR